MNLACLNYCLTEEERRQFETDGYFMVEDVLSSEQIANLSTATDCVDAEHRAQKGLSPAARINVIDFIGKDEAFIELVDWYKTFPKVWGILGWNIQIYHSHLAVTPPENPANSRNLKLGWHQDSDRLNKELETNPRPRISLKVAYFLSDCTAPERGNFYVIPGSHLKNQLDFPNGDRNSELKEGVPVLAPKGSAVFFDRRLWHSASANYWTEPRKVLFYGYSYRWLRPRDDVSVSHYWDRLDPIRRQLFGASATGGYGYTSPKDEDVPLKTWIREHLGAEAVMP
jgi:ectoine hydroxylase-related dioxygenase (phytanoyl-CoA dioxygenase family)